MPEIKLPVSEAEFNDAGSKFAQPGEHLSECTNVDWDTPGQSIKIEFEIVGGDDSGIKNKISCGVGPDAIWKFKETLKALGVEVTMVKGSPNFNTEDCIGKQFLSVWTMEMDKRPLDKGGTGKANSKPTGAKAIKA